MSNLSVLYLQYCTKVLFGSSNCSYNTYKTCNIELKYFFAKRGQSRDSWCTVGIIVPNTFDSLVPLGIIVEVALSKGRIIPSKLFLFLRVTTQPTKLAPINQQYLVLRKWLVGKTGHKSFSLLLHTKSHETACALQNKSYLKEQWELTKKESIWASNSNTFFAQVNIFGMCIGIFHGLYDLAHEVCQLVHRVGKALSLSLDRSISTSLITSEAQDVQDLVREKLFLFDLTRSKETMIGV